MDWNIGVDTRECARFKIVRHEPFPRTCTRVRKGSLGWVVKEIEFDMNRSIAVSPDFPVISITVRVYPPHQLCRVNTDRPLSDNLLSLYTIDLPF